MPSIKGFSNHFFLFWFSCQTNFANENLFRVFPKRPGPAMKNKKIVKKEHSTFNSDEEILYRLFAQFAISIEGWKKFTKKLTIQQGIAKREIAINFPARRQQRSKSWIEVDNRIVERKINIIQRHFVPLGEEFVAPGMEKEMSKESFSLFILRQPTRDLTISVSCMMWWGGRGCSVSYYFRCRCLVKHSQWELRS